MNVAQLRALRAVHEEAGVVALPLRPRAPRSLLLAARSAADLSPAGTASLASASRNAATDLTTPGPSLPIPAGQGFQPARRS
ncbi:hypothetical protein JOL79_28930 [Microbispora sp. RL4-1S]|uniref:Uncharacterized protein n=1 Tax=Microbispora oryzae TaxID=2806554 RepID=A0A940WQN9_9ACTN|nr:hypothetical protein [Microbispora oryzae]MBP2707812.1 hypothetical protein [Microbispora oryzae]